MKIDFTKSKRNIDASNKEAKIKSMSASLKTSLETPSKQQDSYNNRAKEEIKEVMEGEVKEVTVDFTKAKESTKMPIPVQKPKRSTFLRVVNPLEGIAEVVKGRKTETIKSKTDSIDNNDSFKVLKTGINEEEQKIDSMSVSLKTSLESSQKQNEKEVKEVKEVKNAMEGEVKEIKVDFTKSKKSSESSREDGKVEKIESMVPSVNTSLGESPQKEDNETEISMEDEEIDVVEGEVREWKIDFTKKKKNAKMYANLNTDTQAENKEEKTMAKVESMLGNKGQEVKDEAKTEVAEAMKRVKSILSKVKSSKNTEKNHNTTSSKVTSKKTEEDSVTVSMSAATTENRDVEPKTRGETFGPLYLLGVVSFFFILIPLLDKKV
jgi:hypothetical protein